MGFRFRKSIKILPGVRANFGKSGLTSVSVGKRGLSANVGKKDVHVNVGIPGSGLSYREKIGGASSLSSSEHRANLEQQRMSKENGILIKVVLVGAIFLLIALFTRLS
jgi:hypothetical protein